MPCVVDSGKEYDGVDQPQLNQFGPCLWWAGRGGQGTGGFGGQVVFGGYLGKGKFPK